MVGTFLGVSFALSAVDDLLLIHVPVIENSLHFFLFSRSSRNVAYLRYIVRDFLLDSWGLTFDDNRWLLLGLVLRGRVLVRPGRLLAHKGLGTRAIKHVCVFFGTRIDHIMF